MQERPAGNFQAARASTERPLIGIVSRFADQKGFDLIAKMAPANARGLDPVALGNGEREYEQLFRDLPAVPAGSLCSVAYDNAIAHKIEAGADMFLMPSRYEPCGLNQIYSLRYGTVPVVRATGGLDDTIQPFDSEWHGYRLQVRPIHQRGAAGHHPRGPRRLPEPRRLADPDAQRHGQGLLVACSAREYVRVYERVVQARSTITADVRNRARGLPMSRGAASVKLILALPHETLSKTPLPTARRDACDCLPGSHVPAAGNEEIEKVERPSNECGFLVGKNCQKAARIISALAVGHKTDGWIIGAG